MDLDSDETFIHGFELRGFRCYSSNLEINFREASYLGYIRDIIKLITLETTMNQFRRNLGISGYSLELILGFRTRINLNILRICIASHVDFPLVPVIFLYLIWVLFPLQTFISRATLFPNYINLYSFAILERGLKLHGNRGRYVQNVNKFVFGLMVM